MLTILQSDAVANSIADRLGISKADIVNPDSSGVGGSAAVKLALAETHIIAETKKYFEQVGVVIRDSHQCLTRSLAKRRLGPLLATANSSIEIDHSRQEYPVWNIKSRDHRYFRCVWTGPTCPASTRWHHCHCRILRGSRERGVQCMERTRIQAFERFDPLSRMGAVRLIRRDRPNYRTGSYPSQTCSGRHCIHHS